MNPLMGGGAMNIMQMLGQLKQNPMALLQQAGFNVPANLNSPQDIIQHLMNSGQVNQNQVNQAQQQAQAWSQMFGQMK